MIGRLTREVRKRTVPLALIAGVVTPVPAVGQQIAGRVVDMLTDQALAGALVVLLDDDGGVHAAAMSDSAGDFVLGVRFSDQLRLRAQFLGYDAFQTEPFRLEAEDSLRVVVPLAPSPVVLDEIQVSVTSRRNRNLEDFLRRQRSGFGNYIGPEEIAQLKPKSTSWILAGRTAALGFGGPAGNGLAAAPGPDGCPQVYIDGVRLEGESIGNGPGFRYSYIPLDAYVPAHHIRAVEIYKVHQQAPPEFQRPWTPPQCPVVLIWTSFGFGDFDPLP